MARSGVSFRPPARTGGVVSLIVLALLSAALLFANRSPSTTSSATPAPGGRVPAGTLDAAGASGALTALAVADRGTLAGYERDCGHGAGCVFGPAWADVDRNGCGQRDDVLRRDLTGVRFRRGTHDCVVEDGTLADPYTGTTVHFTKADAELVPIDHVVPLAAAWTQGAKAWSTERRAAFANDLGNLIATTRSQNSAKGDSTAEEWLPPNGGYACSYGRVVVTVKQRYALSVTHAESAALQRLLARCSRTTGTGQLLVRGRFTARSRPTPRAVRPARVRRRR